MTRPNRRAKQRAKRAAVARERDASRSQATAAPLSDASPDVDPILGAGVASLLEDADESRSELAMIRRWLALGGVVTEQVVDGLLKKMYVMAARAETQRDFRLAMQTITSVKRHISSDRLTLSRVDAVEAHVRQMQAEHSTVYNSARQVDIDGRVVAIVEEKMSELGISKTSSEIATSQIASQDTVMQTTEEQRRQRVYDALVALQSEVSDGDAN